MPSVPHGSSASATGLQRPPSAPLPCADGCSAPRPLRGHYHHGCGEREDMPQATSAPAEVDVCDPRRVSAATTMHLYTSTAGNVLTSGIDALNVVRGTISPTPSFATSVEVEATAHTTAKSGVSSASTESVQHKRHHCKHPEAPFASTTSGQVSVPAKGVATTTAVCTSCPAKVSSVQPVDASLTAPARTVAAAAPSPQRGISATDEGGGTGALDAVARQAAKESYQTSPVLEGLSVDTISDFGLRSFFNAAMWRARDSERSVMLGSATPSSSMANTAASTRLRVNAQAERAPVPCILPAHSHILSSEDGGVSSVASVPFPTVSTVATAAVVPVQAALSLQHLEMVNSCTGHSASTRTPLLSLPPRPRNSATTNSTKTVRAALVAASTVSHDSQWKSRSFLHPPAGLMLWTPTPPSPASAERSPIVAAAAAASRRQSIGDGSSHTSDIRVLLNGSASNSLEGSGYAGVSPCHLKTQGPRGRRNRASVLMTGSPMSIDSRSCNSNGTHNNSSCDGSCSTAHGMVLLLDGAQLCARYFSSSSSLSTAPTAPTMHTGAASNPVDLNACAKGASNTSSRSVTLAPSAGGSRSPSHRPSAMPPRTGMPPTPPKNTAKHEEGFAFRPTQSSCDGVGAVTITTTAVTTSPESDSAAVLVDGEHHNGKTKCCTIPWTHSCLTSDSGSTTAAVTDSSNNGNSTAGAPSAVMAAASTSRTVVAVPTAAGTHRFATWRRTLATSLPSASVENALSSVLTRPAAVGAIPSAQGSIATSPAAHPTTNPSPTKQSCEESESEVRRRNNVRWVAHESPSFRSSLIGSAPSSLRVRPEPLSSCDGHHPLHSGNHAISNTSSSTHSLDAPEQLHPHSPRFTFLYSSFSDCFRTWSAEASVDVPLDACFPVTASHKTDSLCCATESSFTTNASRTPGSGPVEAPLCSSVVLRQLNSFSRISAVGNVAQRSSSSRSGSGSGESSSYHCSVVIAKAASTASSGLARSTPAAATRVSSITCTTTTTTTMRTSTAANSAAAAAVVVPGTSPQVCEDESEAAHTAAGAIGAATTTVTTTAVSSVTCSAVSVVVTQRGASQDTVRSEERSEMCAAAGGDGMAQIESLLLDDPDAPPFARAALRRLRSQSSGKSQLQRSTTNSTSSRCVEGLWRDGAVTTSPKGALARSHNSVAECAVSIVVTGAAQSRSTTHSCVMEAACQDPPTTDNDSLPQRVSQLPPLPTPVESTALVSRHRSDESTPPQLAKPAHLYTPRVYPLSALDPEALRSCGGGDVLPMTAREIHLPKVTRFMK